MPAMPAQLCEASEAPDSAPAFEALASDGRFTVAALFGRMDESSLEQDKGTWSRGQLIALLQALGLEQTGSPSGWARYEGQIGQGIEVQVDILGPAALPANEWQAMGDAIEFAMRDHELIYVNSHAIGGAIEKLGQARTYRSGDGDPQAYAILVLDTCWSTQHYSLEAMKAAAGVRRLSVITNDSESVTGSVASFSALLRALLGGIAKLRQGAPPPALWSSRLREMNRLAVIRSAERVALQPDVAYPRPERYRLATSCAGSTKEARLTPPPGNQARF